VKWPAKQDDGWRKRFAFLPVKIGDEILWLEWFERRFAGEYYEVRKL
jgi:hypothetical protein